MRGSASWLATDGYGPADTIQILQTNLPSLRHLQVNLAPLLPPVCRSPPCCSALGLPASDRPDSLTLRVLAPSSRDLARAQFDLLCAAQATLEHMRRAGVAEEFYISPPSWGGPPTEPTFRPFAAPVVEVRRRIAAAPRGTDFFVRYVPLTPGASAREYRRRRGNRTAPSDPVLELPVPPLREMIHRYRTFDVGYAPCRH